MGKMERSYVVQRYLHMGLRVKVGCKYSESDLLRRCEGDKLKLKRLRAIMADPTMLKPVGGVAVVRRPKPSLAKTLAKKLVRRSDLPKLGPDLKTYVINLKRRPDRLSRITDVCKGLGLEPTFIEAVDGLALAKSGGRFKATKSHEVCLAQKGMSFAKMSGCNNCTYEASWLEGGTRLRKRRTMQMAMAPHRVKATKLTAEGHELWGAIGCNLSHQKVLERFISDQSCKWCLVLEDDATMDMPGIDAQKLFEQGMRLVKDCCPHWALVYLGGSFASFMDSSGVSQSTVKEEERVGKILVQGHLVYQTHAFLIRKTIAKEILANLRSGRAADAALVQFVRKSPERCFIFKPRQILFQPGGASRWKDSDIFVEGVEFCREAKKDGKAYKFRNNFHNLESEGASIDKRLRKKYWSSKASSKSKGATKKKTKTVQVRKPSSLQLKLRAARKRMMLA